MSTAEGFFLLPWFSTGTPREMPLGWQGVTAGETAPHDLTTVYNIDILEDVGSGGFASNWQANPSLPQLVRASLKRP